MRILALILLSAGLLLAPIGLSGPWSHGAAFADDDGGDDGGDDDDGATSTTQNEPTVQQQPSAKPPSKQPKKPPKVVVKKGPRLPVKAPVTLPLPDFAPEIVVLDLSQNDLAVLEQEGFRVLETQALASVGYEISRLSPPPQLGLQAARDRVSLLASGSVADFNHFYRTNEVAAPVPIAASVASPGVPCGHANCAMHELVSWPSAAALLRGCFPPLPLIGIIDTGVNLSHELIDASRIELVRLGSDVTEASQMIHGTAVVSVLVGREGSRVEGLLPDAQLLVADVFSRSGDDERADVFSLIRGLDLMAARQIRVVNLSLAGLANKPLAEVTQRLVEDRQMVLIASVGNAGPDQPVAFPAALPGVVAVTAVDRRGRLYGLAQRGREVDLAAPGVGLLLATSLKGAKEKTGTSFAAPFVTASVALLLATNPALTVDEVTARLTTSVLDLGETGADTLYGAGLLQAETQCQ
jgi:minor extracellular protease Epr